MMPPAPRRKHRLKRWLAGILLLLALIAGGLLFLVTSLPGARTLARWAMRLEPRLSLQIEDGSLWSGLQLRKITWKAPPNAFTLDSLDTQWEWTLSPAPAIHLQRARASGLLLMLKPAPSTTNKPVAASEFFLPFRLKATDVQLRHATLQMDSLTLMLEQANLAGNLQGKNLDIDSLRLQNLSIEDRRPVLPAPEPPVLWFERLDPAQRAPLTLPQITIPLNLRIQEFALEQARYNRGDTTQRIESLLLSADLINQLLTVRTLELDAEPGRLTGSGHIQLSGKMPLDVVLQLETTSLFPSNPVSISATLRHTIAEMDVQAQLTGPTSLDLQGRIHPLEPHLPMQATLSWTHLAWPVNTPSVITSKSGTLTFDGSLKSYAVNLKGQLAGDAIPEGQWSLDAHGDLRQLRCEMLQGNVLNGILEATGTVAWTNGIDWKMEVQSKTINGDFFHASIPTNITSDLQTTGHWNPKDWKAAFQIQSLSADWKGLPLSLQGQLTGGSSQGWTTPGLTLSQPSNTLHLTGSIADEMKLSGTLQLRRLEELVPGLSGCLDGTWSLAGPLRQPDMTLALEASQLAYRDSFQASKASLTAQIQALAFKDSHLKLEVDALSQPGQSRSIEILRLIATGSRASHQLTVDAEGSSASLSLALKGSLDNTSTAWTGDLQRANFSIAELDWTLVDHLPMRWNPETKQATLAPHRWKHNQAELRATEPLLLGSNGNAQLNLVDFNLAELHPWLPESLRIKGSLGAAAHLQWAQGSLEQAAASLDIENGAVQLIPPPSDLVEDTPPLDIAYDTIHLGTELVSQRQWATKLALISKDLGSARAEAHIGITTNRTLGDWSGQIDLDTVRLQLLLPFIPSLRTLSGDLDASIQLSGSLHHPRLHGSLSLTNGAIEALEWPITLGDIHLQANLHGNQADLSGGFRSGTGQGTLDGRFDITNQAWEASLQLSGDRLDLSYDTFAIFQASPSLKLRLQPGHLSLTGDILIPKADITIQKLPDSAVKTSPDAHIMDAESGEKTAIKKSMSNGKRSIDIELQLGDQINLSGYGITSRLAGHLRIRQTDTSTPSANGEIRIEKGEFKAYGQDLHIQTGQFLFAGPLNRPTLYVEAVRNVTDYMVVAGLRIEGPIDALRTSLFSQPSLPDDEILPYLLLGRPLERGDSGAADGMLTSAAVSLGLSQGQGHAASLAESIGIQNFQVGTQGGGEKTEVVVSGDLSSRLQVSYGSNLFAEGTTLKLRYRLARNLFLETVSSLTSSLELLYTFSY